MVVADGSARSAQVYLATCRFGRQPGKLFKVLPGNGNSVERRYLAGRVRRRVSERAVHRSTGRPSRQARVMTRRRDYCQQDGRRSLVMVT